MVPTKGRRRVLPEEQHRRRGLLPPRPQQEGGRRDTEQNRQEAQRERRPSARTLEFTARLRSPPQERHTVPNREQRRPLRLRARQLRHDQAERTRRGGKGCVGASRRQRVESRWWLATTTRCPWTRLQGASSQ